MVRAVACHARGVSVFLGPNPPVQVNIRWTKQGIPWTGHLEVIYMLNYAFKMHNLIIKPYLKVVQSILWVSVSLNIFGKKVSFEFIGKKIPESRIFFSISVFLFQLFRTVLIFIHLHVLIIPK